VIAFLTYIGRSGSTFLSDLLDSYSDINVTLEARMPDGTKRELLEPVTRDKIDGAMAALYADDKFRTWKIDKGSLRQRLEGVDGPAPYPVVFGEVLKECFKDHPGKVCIYKCGHYLEHADHIRSLFPDARFIFVLRDLRAIYNSQKKSISSSVGRPLADNPLAIARRFNRVSDLLDAYEDADWLHVVKYEDLVFDQNAEMAKLLEFLGLPPDAPRQEAEGYADKIPESQKHLHANVGQGAKKDRVDAWRDALSKVEILSIQRAAGAALEKRGYERLDLGPLSLADHLEYFAYLVKSYWQVLLRRLTQKKHYAD
jgi:hypothetical protein